MQILKRLRVRGETVWASQVCVELREDWHQNLLAAERTLVEEVCAHGRPLSQRTLRTVQQEMKLPFTHIFSILARIEAVGWQPPAQTLDLENASVLYIAVDDTVRELATEVDDTVRELAIEVDDKIRELANKVLCLPWLGQVRSTDLRFSFPGETTLVEWIEREVTRAEADFFLPQLLTRLVVADRCTVREELRDVVGAALCSRGAHKTTNLDRRREIFLSRHLCADGPGRSLEEVAKKFDLTGERVRQITRDIKEALRVVPVSQHEELAVATIEKSGGVACKHQLLDAATVSCMASNSVAHLKLRLGILTSRFRANHPLKACTLCMEVDRRETGWAYWHLAHQCYEGSLDCK